MREGPFPEEDFLCGSWDYVASHLSLLYIAGYKIGGWIAYCSDGNTDVIGFAVLDQVALKI